MGQKWYKGGDISGFLESLAPHEREELFDLV